MRRKLALLLLLLLPALTVAQVKIHLEFPNDNPKQVWVGPDLPSTAPANTEKVQVKALDYAPGSFRPTDKLFVWDEKIGNLAAKSMKDLGAAWKLSDSDFALVGSVKVHVEHKGDPVAAAIVEANDSKRTMQQLVDAGSKGDAVFYGLAPGELKVQVSYKVDGKEATPVKQTFDLKLKRDQPQPSFTISIADNVATISAPATNTQTQAKPQPKQEEKKEGGGANIIGTVFEFVIILAVAVVGLYFAYRWISKNEDATQATLKKLGVNIPQPSDPGASAPPAPMPAAPEPQQKIILDDAVPTPIAPDVQTSVYGQTAAAPSAQPRLTGDAGLPVDLAEGITQVGREPGLGLSLAGEDSVSRRHAEIVRQGSQVTVRDLGSTNGTFVNGQKLSGDATLRNGDTVQFGTVRFRYEG